MYKNVHSSIILNTLKVGCYQNAYWDRKSKKSWYNYTVEFYEAKCIHDLPRILGINLLSIKLNKENQTQKYIYYVIPFILSVKIVKIHLFYSKSGLWYLWWGRADGMVEGLNWFFGAKKIMIPCSRGWLPGMFSSWKFSESIPIIFVSYSIYIII